MNHCDGTKCEYWVVFAHNCADARGPGDAADVAGRDDRQMQVL